MPAEAGVLRFFADESILGVGKALAIVRRDLVHPGHPLIPEIPRGSLDTEWMPEVAERGLVVIGRDKKIRTRPGERRLLKEHGLRVFRIGGKRDLTHWQYLERLVRRWADIERRLLDRGPGPWFMLIHERSINEVSLD
jgi:hypothetical protein